MFRRLFLYISEFCKQAMAQACAVYSPFPGILNVMAIFSRSERRANVGAKIETADSSRTTDGKAMPVPAEYQRATDDFYQLLKDARDSADLTTTNQSYTMVQGVFQVFRRRLKLRRLFGS